MACSTRPGVKPILDFIERVTGEKISQSDWHELRELAKSGYDVGRRRVDSHETDEVVEHMLSHFSEVEGSDMYNMYDSSNGGTWGFDGSFEPAEDNYVSDIRGGWEVPYYDANLPETIPYEFDQKIREYDDLRYGIDGRMTEGTYAALTYLFSRNKPVSESLAEVRAIRKARPAIKSAAEAAMTASRDAKDDASRDDLADLSAGLTWATGSDDTPEWVNMRLGTPSADIDRIERAMDKARQAWKDSGDPKWAAVEGALGWAAAKVRPSGRGVAGWITDAIGEPNDD